MTRIVGLAVPYNIPNSYNEVLRPGSMSEWLAWAKEKGIETRDLIPMLWRHGEEGGSPIHETIGIWTSLWDGSDGLYVDGLVGHSWVEKKIRAGKADAMSVSYNTKEGGRKARIFKAYLNGARSFSDLPRFTVDRTWLSEISVTDSPAFKESRFHWEAV